MSKFKKILCVSLVLFGCFTALIVARVFYKYSQGISHHKAKMEEYNLYLERGNAFHENGEYKLAIKEYEKALEIEPDFFIAKDNIASATMMSNPEAWLKKYPDDNKARRMLFQKALHDRDWKTAKSCALLLEGTEYDHGCLRDIETMQELERQDEAYKKSKQKAIK